MKIRHGFVSNSSSSSFVCAVCGSTESGFDACAEDFEMVECPNGHIIDISCFHKVKGEDSDVEIPKDEDGYVPEKDCPCCQLQTLSLNDELNVLRMRSPLSFKELIVEAKKTFGSAKDLRKAYSQWKKDSEKE